MLDSTLRRLVPGLRSVTSTLTRVAANSVCIRSLHMDHRPFSTTNTADSEIPFVMSGPDSGVSARLKKAAKSTKTFGVCFTLDDRQGALLNAMKVFDRHNVQLTRIENRPSPLNAKEQVFFVHFVGEWESEATKALVADIDKLSKFPVYKLRVPMVPWFPRTPADIDSFSQATLDAGGELSADHPGFKDHEYRKRRQAIVEQAKHYRSGDPIPRVEYDVKEEATWKHVYETLSDLYPKCACDEFNKELSDLEKAGVFSPDRIPQLEDVSQYLQAKTAFTLRPVAGLLSGRDFLNALAFRVFFSTQYIRHHSVPLYTPEPDIIHELMGHAPMLANKDFADFSQLIGLASLGASDDEVTKLATCYWFSVEFGLLFQSEGLKAYGAGLLSSFGELQYSTSPTNNKCEIRPWDPFKASRQAYPITTYQPVYFAAKSLAEAKEKMLEYCQMIPKPFSISYDPTTQTISTDVSVTPRPASMKGDF